MFSIIGANGVAQLVESVRAGFDRWKLAAATALLVLLFLGTCIVIAVYNVPGSRESKSVEQSWSDDPNLPPRTRPIAPRQPFE